MGKLFLWGWWKDEKCLLMHVWWYLKWYALVILLVSSYLQQIILNLSSHLFAFLTYTLEHTHMDLITSQTSILKASPSIPFALSTQWFLLLPLPPSSLMWLCSPNVYQSLICSRIFAIRLTIDSHVKKVINHVWGLPLHNNKTKWWWS